MPERDDLGTDLLTAVMVAQNTDPRSGWPDVADRLISYGWVRRPPVLTEAEDLDALPYEAVVLAPTPEGPLALQKSDGMWWAAEISAVPLTSEAILRGFDEGLGGVTVLWVPPAEAGGR